MPTTIRISNEDLTRFNKFTGELQATRGENISQAKGFEALLNRAEAYDEMIKRVSELLEYPLATAYSDDWTMALYAVLGCYEDIAGDVGREQFEQWREELGSSFLVKQIEERLSEFEWDEQGELMGNDD